MRFFNAQVRGGRLTRDELTDLGEGALLELVSAKDILRNDDDLLDAEERAEFEQELCASIAEVETGKTMDLAEMLAELMARHRDR